MYFNFILHFCHRWILKRTSKNFALVHVRVYYNHWIITNEICCFYSTDTVLQTLIRVKVKLDKDKVLYSTTYVRKEYCFCLQSTFIPWKLKLSKYSLINCVTYNFFTSSEKHFSCIYNITQFLYSKINAWS